MTDFSLCRLPVTKTRGTEHYALQKTLTKVQLFRAMQENTKQPSVKTEGEAQTWPLTIDHAAAILATLQCSTHTSSLRTLHQDGSCSCEQLQRQLPQRERSAASETMDANAFTIAEQCITSC